MRFTNFILCAAVALGGYSLSNVEAEARAKCPKGKIYRVTKGICVTERAAQRQGIKIVNRVSARRTARINRLANRRAVRVARMETPRSPALETRNQNPRPPVISRTGFSPSPFGTLSNPFGTLPESF